MGSDDTALECTGTNTPQLLPLLEGGQKKSMSHCDLTAHTFPSWIGKLVSCTLCVSKCVYATVWEREQERVRARHRDCSVFSSCSRFCYDNQLDCFARPTSVSNTHKHNHYIVITVRLMLCSPLWHALSLLYISFLCLVPILSCLLFFLQTVSILEQRLTLTEDKLKECLENQMEIGLHLQRSEEA